MAGSVLHWASRGGPSPTGTTVGDVPLLAGGFCVLHTHGCTCGPANTGPPMGWLVIVRRARRPSGRAAVISLGPLASPVTSPVRRPPPASEKAAVTSRPSTSALTGVVAASSGRSMATSASPPEIRSARLDSTSMRRSPSAAFAVPAADAATSTASSTPLPHIPLMPPPLYPITRLTSPGGTSKKPAKFLYVQQMVEAAMTALADRLRARHEELAREIV